jgi:hypothetical protein
MDNQYSLSSLSSALYEKIKKDTKINITDMPPKILGISYPSFLKRVKENRLLFGEVEKVAEFYGLVVQINIGEIDISNLHAGSKASKKDLYKIIKLTEEIGGLKIENQRLTYENERLKEQLGGGNGKKK